LRFRAGIGGGGLGRESVTGSRGLGLGWERAIPPLALFEVALFQSKIVLVLNEMVLQLVIEAVAITSTITALG
jgi:hypothetical protein